MVWGVGRVYVINGSILITMLAVERLNKKNTFGKKKSLKYFWWAVKNGLKDIYYLFWQWFDKNAWDKKDAQGVS